MVKQLTLRGIPDHVETGIREKARKSGRSLNRVSIELLESALDLKPRNAQKRDLSRLAGQWSEEEGDEFDRLAQTFEQIDEELWPK